MALDVEDWADVKDDWADRAGEKDSLDSGEVAGSCQRSAARAGGVQVSMHGASAGLRLKTRRGQRRMVFRATPNFE